MERLISLFREADYEQWPEESIDRPASAGPSRPEDEPIYFRQLLDYLREQRERKDEESAVGSAQWAGRN